MQEDLVSVVITTYFRNDRLERCLESVGLQSYPKIEIIVVDGSGTDHAAPIVRDYDGVQYIGMTKDEGPHAARSIGAKHSDGEYIQFVDDDDYLLPKKIEKQVLEIQKSDAIGVVYCGKRTESGNTDLPSERFSGKVMKDALAMNTSSCQTSTMLIEGSLVNEILPFKHWSNRDDLTLIIELAVLTKFSYVNEILVRKGEPDNQLSKRYAEFSPIENAFEIINEYEELYTKYPSSKSEFLAQSYRVEARFLIRENYYSSTAIKHYFISLNKSEKVKIKDLVEFTFMLFGKPGWVTGSAIWKILKNQH